MLMLIDKPFNQEEIRLLWLDEESEISSDNDKDIDIWWLEWLDPSAFILWHQAEVSKEVFDDMDNELSQDELDKIDSYIADLFKEIGE